MSRKTQTSEAQRDYITRIKLNFNVMKAETEVLEMRERNLRASINVYKLQQEWDDIEEKLRAEQELTNELDNTIADGLDEIEKDEAESTD